MHPIPSTICESATVGRGRGAAPAGTPCMTHPYMAHPRMTHPPSRHSRQAYFACVSWTDSNIGRVLDAFDATPFAKDAVLAFWGKLQFLQFPEVALQFPEVAH